MDLRSILAGRRLEWGLALGAGLVVLVTACKPPVVDEESYLFMARALAADPLHPYNWFRDWQPWRMEPPSFDFAHPPLHWIWVALWRGLLGEESLPLLRLAAGLPPALLLGWAVARLARRCCAQPGWAAAFWLASPITVLALGAGLMVDLGATALASAGVVAWREGLVWGGAPRRERLWLLAAGALLGLGCATKYPMLVLLPVVALHAWHLGALRRSLPLWGAFALSWGAVELWIGLAHGGFHLFAVLANAGAIARGPLSGRLLGVLARAGLGLLLLALLAGRPWQRLLALGLAGPALLWGRPTEFSPLKLCFLLLLAWLGAQLAVQAVQAMREPPGERGDGWLLGSWVLAVLLGVVLGHNFASGRYLLPAVAPMACLALRGSRVPRWGLGAALAASALLSAGMAWGDMRFSRAGAQLARQVAAQHPAGFFAGEWAFRYELERAGWRYLGPAGLAGELPMGAVVVAPLNAGAGVLPLERLRHLDTLRSSDRFPLRLVDVPGGIGYYGETLGALPVGWRVAPLEEVGVFEVGP